jgi:hypothetical protein
MANQTVSRERYKNQQLGNKMVRTETAYVSLLRIAEYLASMLLQVGNEAVLDTVGQPRTTVGNSLLGLR